MSDYPVNASANTAPAPPSTHTSAPLVVVYWLVVLAPLCWGVYQTVQKSIPLFHVTTTATTPARSPAPAATPAS